MPLSDRLKTMGLMPDMGKITGQMNEKFDALIAKLDEILAELRKRNTGGPQ